MKGIQDAYLEYLGDEGSVGEAEQLAANLLRVRDPARPRLTRHSQI